MLNSLKISEVDNFTKWKTRAGTSWRSVLKILDNLEYEINVYQKTWNGHVVFFWIGDQYILQESWKRDQYLSRIHEWEILNLGWMTFLISIKMNLTFEIHFVSHWMNFNLLICVFIFDWRNPHHPSTFRFSPLHQPTSPPHWGTRVVGAIGPIGEARS